MLRSLKWAVASLLLLRGRRKVAVAHGRCWFQSAVTAAQADAANKQRIPDECGRGAMRFGWVHTALYQKQRSESCLSNETESALISHQPHTWLPSPGVPVGGTACPFLPRSALLLSSQSPPLVAGLVTTHHQALTNLQGSYLARRESNWPLSACVSQGRGWMSSPPCGCV